MTTAPSAGQPAHRAFRNDLLAILKRHAGHLTSQEVLALAAHACGQIIALQDQRTMTREAALQIVTANIEQGNKEVLDNLGNSEGAA